MIFLGDTARDHVTGHEGVVTARTEYLAGHRKLLIERCNCDNGQPEQSWFDEPRSELVDIPNATGWFGFAPAP